MEIEGHPSQDLVDELVNRGALQVEGTASGPLPEPLRFVSERLGDRDGRWLFLPDEVFLTGFDEPP